MNANAKISPNFEKIRGLLFFDPFSTTPPNRSHNHQHQLFIFRAILHFQPCCREDGMEAPTVGAAIAPPLANVILDFLPVLQYEASDSTVSLQQQSAAGLYHASSHINADWTITSTIFCCVWTSTIKVSEGSIDFAKPLTIMRENWTLLIVCG